MSKLSNTDFFVYGALVAMTKNSSRASKISLRELCELTGLESIQLLQSIRNIQRTQQLVVLFFDDEVCIKIEAVVPAVLRSVA